jgi:alpha-galactosidase
MLAAPLLAGNDLRSLSDDIKEILTNGEVIAVDQDPDGKPVQRISDPDAMSVVLVRPLHDGYKAVGLFNRADTPQTITATWASLGITGKKLRVRDLWKHADTNSSADNYSAVVPSHGVVLLKVKSE